VATPGWQYWNKDPKFGELVHQNTREMIRRDRNHPSVLMWEPILNETRYPLDFALKALEITKEEYPYPGRPVAAADVHSAGVKEHYDVVYGWPGDDEKEDKPEQCIFTREFGENVDDWYAHNNNNRASRSWGERPLLVQAMSLAKSYDEMYRTTGLFIGGAQWHPFDHQRGYHPDPYWGGIYDAFRQKKYAYEVFRSQSPASLQHPLAECGPMIFIAHEMSQFSDKDVVVFTNCDSVRLSIYDGTKTWTKPVIHAKGHMPNAPVIFENVWDFWEARGYSYTQKNWQKVNMVAEGIIDGKVVCTQKKMPSRRSTKLRLYVDTQKVNLIADGSDFIVVVAEVTDDSGNVRRLAKENIVFTVEGEGEIIGDATIGANPRAVEFGSAPVLIRSTRKAGKIKVKARVQFEGTQAPTATEIELESVPAEFPFCYEEQTYEIQRTTPSTLNVNPGKEASEGKVQLTEEERQRVLDEVERQQTEFGTEK
ncbi:glycoside hydrolase family 2, partial [Bacteroides ovatus]